MAGLLYRATSDAGVLHFLAQPRGGPAWVRVGELAISHVERNPGEAWRERLRAAAPKIAALPDLAEALGAEIELLPTLPEGVRPPRWPLRLRTGPAGGPFPFDPELAALELGHRELLKREAFDDAEAEADVSWLEARGLEVRQVTAPAVDGRRCLLAARDASTIDRAAPLERDLADPSSVRELGALLGYPPCCVEAYAALGPRGDALGFALRLPDPRDGPTPTVPLFLLSALALVSHLPCAYDCQLTALRATAVLYHLSSGSPAFLDAWFELARARHAIDDEGRAWILGDDAHVEVRETGELVHHRAVELAWQGRTLVADGRRFPLVADHR